LKRPRCRWEDNVRIDLREIGWDVSGQRWGWVAGNYEHSNEPSGSIKGREFLDQVSDY
jgi:hypothetical protein